MECIWFAKSENGFVCFILFLIAISLSSLFILYSEFSSFHQCNPIFKSTLLHRFQISPRFYSSKRLFSPRKASITITLTTGSCQAKIDSGWEAIPMTIPARTTPILNSQRRRLPRKRRRSQSMSLCLIAIARKRSVLWRVPSEFGCRTFIYRERYTEELNETVKRIKNHYRINDWVQLCTGNVLGKEYDK